MELREIYYGYYYYIAFRNRSNFGLNEKWTVIKPSLSEWFADPFLFEWNGRCYLFAERMNLWRKVGSIAVCEILKNGNVTDFKEVIVEPFHLSFPNVFEHNGQIYMIPESGWNKDIRLYRAVNFPTKWEYVKSLCSGENYVDTSFLSALEDGTAILHSFNWDTRSSCYFKLDMNAIELYPLPDNPSMMNERSGGNAYVQNGITYRVLQDCSDHYGSKIIIRRINDFGFDTGTASDIPFSEILPDSLVLDKKLKPTWCHTFNQSEHMEVVDFMSERFVWFGPILTVRNKIFYERHKDLLGE